MDPYDDILPTAPAGRGRAGAKFAPKVKPKPVPRKEISAEKHEISSKDGEGERVASSTITSSKDMDTGPQSKCHAAVASTLSVPPQHSAGSNLEDATKSQMANPQQVGVNVDTAALVDAQPSTDASTEVESAREEDPVALEGSRHSNFVPETNLSNDSTHPVQTADSVEKLSNNVAILSTICSTGGSMGDPAKNVKEPVLDSNNCLGLGDDLMQVGPDVGFENASDNDAAILESNIQSNLIFGREREAESEKFELDPFCEVLPDPGTRTARKFQPKIKPRPRVGAKPAVASASSNDMMARSVELPTFCMNEVQSFQSSDDGISMLNQPSNSPVPTLEIPMATDLSSKFDYVDSSIPFSKDNNNLAAVSASQLDSLDAVFSDVAVHNGTRDLPSSVGKSAAESADIFAGLESIDDFTTQAATTTGKPILQSETEEVVDLSPGCPVDNVSDYQSKKTDNDPASEIPVDEELTNSPNSPTLADLMQDANGRKKEDAVWSSLRKRKKSGANEEDKGVKTSRQRRKQATHKPVSNSANEDDDDDDELDPPYNPYRDELEENDEEFEVDDSSKKKASLNSTKKSVAKNGKTSQKHKKANEDLENGKKEPPKRFSHSSRRKRRCVNQALLEIPEDELDMHTLSLKDIILLAEHRERLAKKEAATSKTSTNQSGGDSQHEAEAGANSEEEYLGSEDDREAGDDEASESVPLASSLFNYQFFMEKTPRGKWTKHDNELFYEAVRQFGTDFSMIQQLFPDRTRHQIKLKYKKEERQHPLRLADAVNNRSKDHFHFKMLIERLQQASAKEDQDPGKDASGSMAAEEVENSAPGTNEDVGTTEQEEFATTEQEANVEDQQDSKSVPSPEQFDNSDDELAIWAQYKSEI
ncbi:hypothetical protein HN51_069026 [Arachis hypogaea]|uniref:uncharacterized protein isoform X1 n=1 Tax=Arachis hypogaea TaxID=3818 RepID=UPI000DECD203|nr:uncharacterized protein LOC112749800 isoform X1 [Arachis hypogaea]XP_025653974.1 uncharacterized protein LOC112749800 isoform X1 [Arachis hypogaea]